MLKITQPEFVVDEQICRANIGKMARKADAHGMQFRPHFKTHQSALIGEWFRDAGVTAITVSSVSMARYFADHGWKDITIAFPVNLLEMDEINRLAAAIQINLLVENEISLDFLKKNLTSDAGIYIEADTGYCRSGVDTAQTTAIDRLLAILKTSRHMTFKGFLSHTGQTYSARSKDDIISLHADALMKMSSLKHRYLPDWPGTEISLGDTPACSVSDDWNEVDEIRPGNFVFYDLMQLQIGSCRCGEIAVKMICPVVSRSVLRNEIVVYGGAVHLSKEFLIGPEGEKNYGAVLIENQESHRKEISRTMRVTGLSQEHGIIRGDSEEINQFNPGDLIEIVPVHSCLTADLAGKYLTTEGEPIEKMKK